MTRATVVSEPAPPSHGAGASRKRWVIALSVLLAMVLVFIAASAYLFVWPPTNSPHRVDGILSLNGADENLRESKAISLAEAGYAPVLLFSIGRANDTPCPVVHGVQVVCFEPDPGTTLGEVRWASHYAHAHGWHSMMIVPERAQSVRARFLAERCFGGQVIVVPASAPRRTILYNVVYEWGALTRALILYRNC
jgi:hypothetical protein